jgi:hypothetical protein
MTIEPDSPLMLPLIDATLAVLKRHGYNIVNIRAFFGSLPADDLVSFERIASRFNLPTDNLLLEVASEMSARTGLRCVPEDRGVREVLQ